MSETVRHFNVDGASVQWRGDRDPSPRDMEALRDMAAAMKRMTTIPLVTKQDQPPGGDPSECFWCRAREGKPHSIECVRVGREVTFGVYVLDDEGKPARRIGSWTNLEPWSADVETNEFMRNEGSWCADNMRDEGIYDGEPLPEVVDGCLCNSLRFKVERRGEEMCPNRG